MSQPHRGSCDKDCDKNRGRAWCRDSISLLGKLTKVQKEMHRNYGPTSEPNKYAAAKEETQLGGDLKERSGLLKAPVFLFFSFFSFIFFCFYFYFILD